MSVETEIVAPINFNLNLLPAPINCKKRALQGKYSFPISVSLKIESKVEVKTQTGDCGATCRYQLSDAIVMSKWRISHEQKQPLIGLKWIQGQSASSLLFIELDETELDAQVTECVDGKRAWRRHMSRNVKVWGIDFTRIQILFFRASPFYLL